MVLVDEGPGQPSPYGRRDQPGNALVVTRMMPTGSTRSRPALLALPSLSLDNSPYDTFELGSRRGLGRHGHGSGPDRMVMLMEALVEFLEAVEGNFQQGPPPAIDLRTPQRIVDDLPVRKILQVPSVDNGQQPECYICLSLFEQGEDARRLPCGHEFHVACIDRWLLDVHRTCPCCRSDICAMAGSGSAQAEDRKSVV